ncbi:hypothetical protein E7T09_04165 [Deinococcus sp. KSM4-11]|uniref:DUF7669 domain-containing protein n=1 Tax=Deinococcus sp. KSM4-11 TaxID=2568654 RepID=UPI0010A3B559|nr:hypothetical protein [Deinococcus sp. KSM4-11]THF88409.1 hypothetical protein E7T09_04165 [Deinococcus sp. KSM4-11]
MTCREAILDAIRDLLRGREDQTFTPVEVALFMLAREAPYKELTIRGTISHLMCTDEPDPTGRRSQELERVGRGRYRLR